MIKCSKNLAPSILFGKDSDKSKTLMSYDHEHVFAIKINQNQSNLKKYLDIRSL